MTVPDELLLPTDFNRPDTTHLLAFNARGDRLAAYVDGGDHLIAFDPRSGREVSRLKKLPHVVSMDFLSGDVLLIVQQPHLKGSKYQPGRCVRWDLRKGSREVIWEHESLKCVAASPKGRVAAFGVERGIVLYDAIKKKIIHQRTSKLEMYSERAFFSPGGQYAAIVLCPDNSSYVPRLIVVWEVAECRRQRTFDISTSDLLALAFREDTLEIAVAVWSDVHVFEPDCGEDPVATHKCELVSALRFRDRGMLAMLLDNGEQVFLHARTGRIERRVPPPSDRPIRNSTANADWSQFAAATEGGVFVWKNVRSG